MTLKSILSHLTILGVFFTVFGTRTLYALPKDGIGAEGSPAVRRMLASSPTKIRIVGELSCVTESAETNPSHCSLFVKEHETGKSYRLTGESETAQKLFHSGNHNAAIEGTLTNETTVSVQTAQAL
jgi:hypothetical protein